MMLITYGIYKCIRNNHWVSLITMMVLVCWGFWLKTLWKQRRFFTWEKQIFWPLIILVPENSLTLSVWCHRMLQVVTKVWWMTSTNTDAAFLNVDKYVQWLSSHWIHIKQPISSPKCTTIKCPWDQNFSHHWRSVSAEGHGSRTFQIDVVQTPSVVP